MTGAELSLWLRADLDERASALDSLLLTSGDVRLVDHDGGWR